MEYTQFINLINLPGLKKYWFQYIKRINAEQIKKSFEVGDQFFCGGNTIENVKGWKNLEFVSHTEIGRIPKTQPKLRLDGLLQHYKSFSAEDAKHISVLHIIGVRVMEFRKLCL